MNRDRLLTKLRIFSNGALSKGVACFFLFSLISCSTKEIDRQPELVSKEIQSEDKKYPYAPWEVWAGKEEVGNPEIAAADKLNFSSHIQEAIKGYENALVLSISPEDRSQALKRKLAAELKLGRSEQVLADIARHLQETGTAITEVPSEISLLSAFAYLHKRDLDQALAWFSLSYRRSSGQGIVARRGKQGITIVARKITDRDFPQALTKWQGDKLVAEVMAKESERRRRGIQLRADVEPNWFTPETYGENLVRERAEYATDFVERDIPFTPQEPVSEESGLPPAVRAGSNGSSSSGTAQGTANVYALLPLTGQYGEHAERVKRGLELGFDSAIKQRQVYFEAKDTAGSEGIALDFYRSITGTAPASAFIGPMLLKEAQAIGRVSDTVGVPVLTFTKGDRVPQLAETMFRLGATAMDQADNLVSYAKEQLRARNFAILYPQNENAIEFVNAFKAQVRRQEAQLVAEVSYNPIDEASKQAAVSNLGEGVDAVFVPDTLENAVPIIIALRNSQHAQSSILGPAFWDDVASIRSFGHVLDGVYYATPFFIQSSDPNVEDFIQKFRLRFGNDPDILSAQAYDAAILLLNAFKESGRGARDVEQHLKNLNDFKGVTGQLASDKDGDIHRKMSIVKVDGTQAVEVSFGGLSKTIEFNEKRQIEERAY